MSEYTHAYVRVHLGGRRLYIMHHGVLYGTTFIVTSGYKTRREMRSFSAGMRHEDASNSKIKHGGQIAMARKKKRKEKLAGNIVVSVPDCFIYNYLLNR